MKIVIYDTRNWPLDNIIEEVAQALAQNAPIERFLSIPGLGVAVHAVERDLLVTYPVIDVRGDYQ